MYVCVYGMVWYGMVWYGMLCYAMLCYAMLWYGMLWYGMVWYVCILSIYWHFFPTQARKKGFERRGRKFTFEKWMNRSLAWCTYRVPCGHMDCFAPKKSTRGVAGLGWNNVTLLSLSEVGIWPFKNGFPLTWFTGSAWDAILDLSGTQGWNDRANEKRLIRDCRPSHFGVFDVLPSGKLT